MARMPQLCALACRETNDGRRDRRGAARSEDQAHPLVGAVDRPDVMLLLSAEGVVEVRTPPRQNGAGGEVCQRAPGIAVISIGAGSESTLSWPPQILRSAGSGRRLFPE